MRYELAKAEEGTADTLALLAAGWEPFAALREPVWRTPVSDPVAEAWQGHRASSGHTEDATVLHFRRKCAK